MPDAIITSTASTFGTISGTFAADQSTVTGTVTGIVAGTLSGSVGVPGPAGPGVPAGGTAGQYLQKIDGVDYNTDWVTLNLSGYAPLASPAFTGDPTAPTAALGDNDTSLATTAFVQQELLSGTANAKNLEVYVRNQTGSTLAAGSIVYINGATGNRPTVTLAQANNDANSAQTMGFVKTAIANNGFGFVIVRGECENLDTSAVSEGTQLYLSPTVAGAYTTTKPSAPQHLVYVGIVIRSHPTQGVILVAVQNGYELDELHDVSITSPTNGQVLKYNSTTGLWYNGTDSAGVTWGGITGTLSSQTDLQTALDGKYSTTNPAGYITSSALSPYLTSATAASTYQTLSGMSSYLTTSAAASTYAPKASPTFTGLSTFNNPGNYAITLDNSVGNYTSISSGVYSIFASTVEVIRLSAGGIKYPDGVTQSVAYPGPSGFLLKADNLSGLANTGTARTNLGLGTMATETASNYLTTATAASTYQTLAGMSSYLTTATAASTYFTIASAANKADLASPVFTGDPQAPTPATSDNDTSIATTAFVKAQGYLTSAPVTSVAGKTGAVTLAVADVSGAAPTDSPALTGTPSLPTGTIAVTQSAGNNTTAVATTAFVQQEVPAASTTAAGKVELATIGEALQGNSTTLVPSLEAMTWAMMNSSFRPYFNVTGGSSGTGAFTNPVPPFRYEVGSPNTLTAGNAYVHTNNLSGMSPGRSQGVFDFGKKFWVSFALDNLNATYVGDANNEMKVYWGPSPSNGDDPAGMAIGVFKAGGSSSVWNLMVHDGTTLRKVASTVTLTTGEVQRFMIYSDGAGNVKMYINGTEAATSANGPTGTRSDARFVASVKQTASATARILIVLWYPKICSAP